MVTKEQAMTANYFHTNECKRRKPAPNGKNLDYCVVWRRNGSTQTWKTQPERFRVPIKFGLYKYGEINETNAWQFHVSTECPEGLRPNG